MGVTIQQLFGWGLHRNTEMQLMLLHCQEKVNPFGWKRWSGIEHFCVSLHNLRLSFLARVFWSRRYLWAWNCWYRWLCTNIIYPGAFIQVLQIRNTEHTNEIQTWRGTGVNDIQSYYYWVDVHFRLRIGTVTKLSRLILLLGQTESITLSLVYSSTTPPVPNQSTPSAYRR